MQFPAYGGMYPFDGGRSSFEVLSPGTTGWLAPRTVSTNGPRRPERTARRPRREYDPASIETVPGPARYDRVPIAG